MQFLQYLQRLRCRSLSVFLLALVAMLYGCSSSRTLEPVELESFDAEGKLKVLWSANIKGDLGEYYHQFRLAQDGQYLYAASKDGYVAKLDKSSGDKAWRVDLDQVLTTAAVVDDMHVYIATESGTLLALDKANGEQQWAAQLRSELISVPVASANAVFAQASNGDIYKFDRRSGEQLWRVDTNIPALSLRGNARPVMMPQLLVVGLANGKLALINPDSGQIFAEPRVAMADGDTEVERMVDVDGSPAFKDGKLYAVSFQGQLVALNMQQGKVEWDKPASSFQDVAFDFDTVYIATADSLLQGYNARNGELKWSQDGLLRRRITAAVPYSSYLVVSDLDGYIHLLSQLDGRFIARKKIHGSGVKSPALVDLVDNTVFFIMANNGSIKAYRYLAD